MTNLAVIDDAQAIRMVLQRLCADGTAIHVAYQANRSETSILAEDQRHIYIRMDPADIPTWALKVRDNLTLKLEDRGFKYETVLEFAGPGPEDAPPSWCLSLPRVLRRTDGHRLPSFIPDDPPKCTFTNLRNDLLDGFVRGFGSDGVELALRDPKVKPQDVMRMGEKSTLDVALSPGLKITAPATVSYFGDDFVGLTFDKEADKALLGQYRTWLQEQQRMQAQRDRDAFNPNGVKESVSRVNRAAVLPGLKLLVDKDPLFLILTEKQDLAQRVADTLSRKYGMAYLDYIKGPLKPQLTAAGAGEGWGRVKLVLIHNQLRLTSQLEVCRNLTGAEKCELPVVLLGGSDDEELKRKRALEAGAVDYLSLEPFKPLSLLRKLDETLGLFS